MPRNLDKAVGRPFDVVVIGGGSHGAAVVRDAAMRGLRAAVVEKEDFGAGTVSRSTRLIHGGLRYLERLELRLVREGLREREILLRTAPHLVRPLAFFTPVYAGGPVSLGKMRLGLALYDGLARGGSLPRRRFLAPRAAAAAEPLLDERNLLGAFVYYDGHVPTPERLCLEAARQAARRGALVVNHARAVHMMRTGNMFTLGVRDELTGRTYELRSRTVVNATGPWADEVNDLLVGAREARRSGPPRRLRPTKGVHLLVPKLSRRAVVMAAEADGRLFFAIPWGDDFTYVGTTDTDFHGDLDEVRADEEDVRYLLAATRRVFPRADLDNVPLAAAGVRPLFRHPRAGGAGSVSRRHVVRHHEDEGLPGYFSAFGGKLTNMRAVAEEAVDRVIAFGQFRADPCTTHLTLFPGAMHPDMELLKTDLGRRAARAGIGQDTVDRAVNLYGSEAPTVLHWAVRSPDLRARVRDGGPDVWAQLAYGVRREWVYTTADFLLRRTPIGFGPGRGLDVAPAVARRLGALFRRTAAEVRADLEDYARQAELLARPKAAPPGGDGSEAVG